MRKDLFMGERKLRPRTTKDVAYERMKQAIIEGRLRPGERLVESELAELLDISRTPLREALVQLDREGFIRRMAHRGAFVADVSLQEIRHLNAVRSVLEGLAARTVAEKVAEGAIEEASLHQLGIILDQMALSRDTGDVEGHLRLGREFHELIWTLADNDFCTRMLRQVVDAVERYRHLAPEHRMEGVIADHRQLLEAMRRGAADEAEALMRTHIGVAGKYYARAIDEVEKQRRDDN